MSRQYEPSRTSSHHSGTAYAQSTHGNMNVHSANGSACVFPTTGGSHAGSAYGVGLPQAVTNSQAGSGYASSMSTIRGALPQMYVPSEARGSAAAGADHNANGQLAGSVIPSGHSGSAFRVSTSSYPESTGINAYAYYGDKGSNMSPMMFAPPINGSLMSSNYNLSSTAMANPLPPHAPLPPALPQAPLPPPPRAPLPPPPQVPLPPLPTRSRHSSQHAPSEAIPKSSRHNSHKSHRSRHSSLSNTDSAEKTIRPSSAPPTPMTASALAQHAAYCATQPDDGVCFGGQTGSRALEIAAIREAYSPAAQPHELLWNKKHREHKTKTTTKVVTEYDVYGHRTRKTVKTTTRAA
ncbi:hypothetical protein CYLTODRAFT_443286 [Cylindrobasidium torrendii FP15055 ss-10]|uniref:Uncharacterized protein n=1 Tax=Cylindrobasidium torrendii FP15055 ss-10 TaxID=1314674 RepID=A0A0D7BDG4_9AGAR|nr:hypothetical protein CYLTODRAFT_443286 [Cylindrobasidium torrendii FP15055 ss-10]